MNFEHNKWKVLLILILVSFLLVNQNLILAQEEKEEDVPKEQMPVEDRETGDSVIETIGEVPGKLVSLPLKLFFKGVSKAAGAVDYNAIVLRVTDWLTNEDGTRKVRPIFVPVSGAGLIFIQDNLFRDGMRFRAVGSFGNRTRKYFYGGLRDTQLFSSKFGLQVEGFYKRLPDEDFFGIGNESLKKKETNYLHEESNFEIEILSVPFKKAIFAAGLSYSKVNVKQGRDPSTRTSSLLDSAEVFFGPVPGLFGAEMWTLLFRMYHDSRNATGNPTKGGEEYFSYEFSRELGGSEFAYRKFTIDLRRYIELFYSRVLALRLQTEITDNLGGKEIPFYRLSGLGGQDILRGYRPRRFRDKDLMLVGAEYRFPIHSSMDGYIFFEEGRVFSNIFDEFTLKDFKYSAGGGLRIRSKERNLVALIEIAKSKEQLRFYFSLNKGLRRF